MPFGTVLVRFLDLSGAGAGKGAKSTATSRTTIVYAWEFAAHAVERDRLEGVCSGIRIDDPPHPPGSGGARVRCRATYPREKRWLIILHDVGDDPVAVMGFPTAGRKCTVPVSGWCSATHSR